MYQYHLILLTTFFLAACSGNDGKVIHPTTEFLEEIKAADYTVSLNDENLPSISILNNRKTINIIGETEDVDSEYFLPEVGDISVGSKLIFIVIPQMNEIRAFDYLGNFKYKIGRTGHGPGEFEKLHSIDYDEASKKLVAVDLNEVEIFDVKPDTAIPSQTFIITQVSHLSDACILNGELFLNGSNISEVDTLESDASIYSRLQALPPINKYDLETGEKLFHFGKSYKSVSGFGGFDALLSETKLHCNESTNTIVGVFSRYPFIAGYDPANGSEKWNAGILDFISPQVEEKDIENNVALVPIRSSFSDKLGPIVELNSEFILLQTGVRPPHPESLILERLEILDFRNSKFVSMLLNTSTGKISILSDELGRTLFQNDEISITSPTDLENLEAPPTIVIGEPVFSF